MGRTYQSHDRYEENFVTMVEFIFDQRHLSSSSIGGGRILCCSSCKRSPQAILLSLQSIYGGLIIVVNAPTVKKYEAKCPKAADCLAKDRYALLTFCDFQNRQKAH